MPTTYFHINYELDPQTVREEIDRKCGMDGAGYICVADGNILSMVHSDETYRKTVGGAMFSLCDSSWVPLYIKLLYGFKPEQYCGSQIFKDLTEARKYRMYFLGASQTVLDALKCNLEREVDPAIGGMTFKELPFCSVEQFDYKSIAAGINSDSPDIIWVALGAPKQEQFAERLTPLLKRGVVIPVGAVFNFRAGLGIKRAPQWMIDAHLEWLYRIFSEPKKQLRRVKGILADVPAILLEERRAKRR